MRPSATHRFPTSYIIPIAAVLTLGLSPSAGAAHTRGGGQVEHFYRLTSGLDCDGSVRLPGQALPSFAAFEHTSDGTIAAQVGLFRADPNSRYHVDLVQTPGDCSAQSIVIETNDRGIGSGHVSAKVGAGKSGAFVTAENGDHSILVSTLYLFGGSGKGRPAAAGHPSTTAHRR